MKADAIEKKIKTYFDDQIGILAVMIFGSFGTGKQTDKSDVDIAVLYEQESIPNKWELLDTRETISEIVSRDIDLICLNTANPIIGMQIYKTGKVIYLRKGSQDLDRYFMKLVSQYIELKELRKPMEDAILKRKIHD